MHRGRHPFPHEMQRQPEGQKPSHAVPKERRLRREIGAQSLGEPFAQLIYVRHGLFPVAFLMAGELHGEQAYVIGEQGLPRKE